MSASLVAPVGYAHLISVSAAAVTVRAGLLAVQLVIEVWWAVRLLLG